MLLGVAQTGSVTGDYDANIDRHLLLLQRKQAYEADLVLFPELSLTGYEPTLAAALAIDPHTPRLGAFQRYSDAHGTTLGVGAPTLHDGEVRISVVWFTPHAPRRVYSKQHLHADEQPYFTPGPPDRGLAPGRPEAALAICYELSVPEHAEAASRAGASVYLASVAKTARGVESAGRRLSELAAQHGMNTLMANGVGRADGVVCAGGSAVWGRSGALLAGLNQTEEGLVVLDTERQRAIVTLARAG